MPPTSQLSSSSSSRSKSPSITRKHHAASKLQRTFRKTRTRGFCSICYSYYNDSPIITRTNCKHTFHQNCIENWHKRNKTCPMCREITIEGITNVVLENDVVASDVAASPEEINRDRQTMINVRRALAEAKAARPLTRSAARPLARAKARRERDIAIGEEAAKLEKASANKAALIQAAKSMTASAANLMIEAVELKKIQDVYWKIATKQAQTNADAALEELNAVALLDKLNKLSPTESLEPLRTQALTIKSDATRYLSELNP